MGLEDEYRLDYLEDQGFLRKKCESCGYYFWTLDEGRKTCGDPPCDDYGFIDDPPIEDEFDLSGMREYFLRFFEDRRHERAKRRPVIARWRDDIFLTIASIADFQPHVTNGNVPPPYNPLVISQPCIRLDDIDSVGKSGRHLTSFEMMAHHAFNFDEDHVYWKDKTVELCQELLTDLGIDENEIIYKENPWAGGGNAGPAFEVLTKGLELSTLVFMNMVQDKNGEYNIKGENYSKMDSKIVDTGYGLERFVWASKGTPTVYDAIYGDVVDEVMELAELEHKIEEPEYREVLSEHAKLSGYMDVDTSTDLHKIRKKVSDRMNMDTDKLREMMEPVEDAYAITDHARTIALMLGDGIVPSNTEAGYLVRLVIRKALRMMDSLGINAPLSEIVNLHLDRMKESFPEFKDKKSKIDEITDLEEDRFKETLSKGRKLVSKTANHYKDNSGTIPLDSVVDLYDTHGIPPEVTKEVASEYGVETELPDDFYARVAKKHESPENEDEEKTDETIERLKELPNTDLLFYKQLEDYSFESVVLDVIEDKVILEQTLFYPEGGGQPSDTGNLDTGDKILDIKDVKKVNGVIVHYLEETDEIKKGDVVTGNVDEERRKAHKRHHTATHIILEACRNILGDHIWQAGSQLSEDEARLDLTHFKSITREELYEIEKRANQVVMDNREVKERWMNRNDAEEEYGFVLYQGGAPESKEIRVIEVENWSVQACGGTHCASTGDVGPIKITGTESVKDGVIRLKYTAGTAAIESIQERDKMIRKASETFSVPPQELPETSERFFEEWKDRGKKISDLKDKIALMREKNILRESNELNGFRVYNEILDDSDMEGLRKTANQLKEEDIIGLLVSGRGEIIVSVGDKAIREGINANQIIKEITKEIGGGGGGDKSLAQGKIPAEKKKKAVLGFSDLVSESLNSSDQK
ncbi:MAG: Alanyl-tRNA synthetase [Candidatus Methanohalarchaeum thermophilum]|uniref:Alanine--tRNA ligase n=1 Tax=Methanohalarchaeum thermophilum TaxID=1903181 RepID=A0A1Q6DT89_METT1|nr:MAG: Alanyl-tRNA synthetase [Candidatus Methanohalarchaeum thermophilum]